MLCQIRGSPSNTCEAISSRDQSAGPADPLRAANEMKEKLSSRAKVSGTGRLVKKLNAERETEAEPERERLKGLPACLASK